jgi:hypothetical protein
MSTRKYALGSENRKKKGNAKMNLLNHKEEPLTNFSQKILALLEIQMSWRLLRGRNQYQFIRTRPDN